MHALINSHVLRLSDYIIESTQYSRHAKFIGPVFNVFPWRACGFATNMLVENNRDSTFIISLICFIRSYTLQALYKYTVYTNLFTLDKAWFFLILFFITIPFEFIIVNLNMMSCWYFKLSMNFRFQAGKIYTYIGEVCVSVNPYRQMNIYGSDYVNKYKGKPLDRMQSSESCTWNQAFNVRLTF